jgi:hypothetical protein
MGSMGTDTGLFLAKSKRPKKYRTEISALYRDVCFWTVWFFDGYWVLGRSPDRVGLSQHGQLPAADLAAVTMHDPGHVLIFDPTRDHPFLAILFCAFHGPCRKPERI